MHVTTLTWLYRYTRAACRRQASRALRQHSSRCCGSTARAEDAGEEEQEQDNALQGALRWAFTKTGLQGIAEALDDNWAVSVAIVVLYLASLAASFASGGFLHVNVMLGPDQQGFRALA